MECPGSSIRLYAPNWFKSLIWLISAVPTGIVSAKTPPELTSLVNVPIALLTSPSVQTTGQSQVSLEQKFPKLHIGDVRPVPENNASSPPPSDFPSQTQIRDAKQLTGGMSVTENPPASGATLSLPSVSGVHVKGTESPVVPQTPAPELRPPAKEPMSSSSSGVAPIPGMSAVSGTAPDGAELSATSQNSAPPTTAVPTEVPVAPHPPVSDEPVNALTAAPMDAAELPDAAREAISAEVPVNRSSSAPLSVRTESADREQSAESAAPPPAPQPEVASTEVSVTPPVPAQPDKTPQKAAPGETVPVTSEKPVDGAEVPMMPDASVPMSETPGTPADAAGTPALQTAPTGKAESPAPAEKVVPRILSEEEQNSYVVGMVVADYARSVLLTLGKLDVSPDERLFREGLQDALSGKPELDNSVAQAAMLRIQKQADRRQAELDAVSRQTLLDIAEKYNTVEKKEDRIWVRLKKGGPAVSKQTPLSLSWEGQFYNGAIFESVTDAAVTRREVLPSWLQRAIRLAGPGGEVRLFILAGSLEGEAPLPTGTGRHELVQYTVSVKKG